MEVYDQAKEIIANMPVELRQLEEVISSNETDVEKVREALAKTQAVELKIGIMFREAKRKLATQYKDKIVELNKEDFYSSITAEEKKEYLRSVLAEEKSLVELCGDLQKIAENRIRTCQSILNSINSTMRSGIS